MVLAKVSETRAAILRDCPFFACFSVEELQVLALSAAERVLLPGEFLFQRGERPDRLYVLGRGIVKSIVYSSSGKALTLSLYASGDVVGEAAFLTGDSYASSCTAVTKAWLLVIPRSALLPLLPSHPEVPLKAIEILVRRIVLLQSRLENIAGASAEQRLISILLYLERKFGRELPLTKGAIAELAGLTTETVIRIMSCLERGGLVSSRRGCITFLDVAGLERLLGA